MSVNFELMKSVLLTFKGESDRGVFIVIAAILENHLEGLIKSKLINPLNNKETLFDGPYAPFNNFSTKIDVAYRLGLIDQHILQCLHLIRGMRNDSAHSSLTLTFGTPSIRDRIRELFKINESLFSAMREDIVGIYPELKNSQNKFDSAFMTNVFGWRNTFQLVAALIVVTLDSSRADIEPIIP